MADQTESGSGALYDDAAYTSDMVTSEEPKPKAGGYKFLSLAVLLLTVGGLFIGLLGGLLSALSPKLILDDFSAEGVLHGSLIGNIIYIFKTLFGEGGGDIIKEALNPHLTEMGFLGLASSAIIILHFALVLAVLLSLVLGILSLCISRISKRCAYASAYVSLFVYGALFGCIFYTQSVGGSMAAALGTPVSFADLLDVPTLIITAALTLALMIAALARRKGAGLWNVILYLLSAAALFAFFYPNGNDDGNCIMNFQSSVVAENGIDTIALIFVLTTGILLIVNAVISAIRLSAKKAYGFDLARGILQLALVVGLTLVFILKHTSDTPTGDVALNVLANISYIVMIAATVAFFLFAILFTVLAASKRRREEDAEALASLDESESAESPAEEHDEEKDDPIPTISSIMGSYDPAAEPKSENAETPMSEFEKTMQALARGEVPQSTPAYTPTPAPAPSYQMPAKQPTAPAAGFAYDPTQYTYDPFINALTPQEKNEFGDLFIAGKSGKLGYLPTYVIGGDNAEFFRKVFIYLGRFRKDISSGLLDKLYVYVSKS